MKDRANERLDEYLTVKQAATILGVSADTLRNWNKPAKLKKLRHPMNGYRLYSRAELESFLDGVASGKSLRR